jgi:hypothetical protein
LSEYPIFVAVSLQVLLQNRLLPIQLECQLWYRKRTTVLQTRESDIVVMWVRQLIKPVWICKSALFAEITFEGYASLHLVEANHIEGEESKSVWVRIYFNRFSTSNNTSYISTKIAIQLRENEVSSPSANVLEQLITTCLVGDEKGLFLEKKFTALT